MAEKDRFGREMLDTPSQGALDYQRQRILERHGIACSSTLDYDDEEGCIRLCIGPVWLHTNALLRLKDSTDGVEYWVQHIRIGPSAKESFVRLIPVPKGAALELSMAAVLETYESTGHRTLTPQLEDYSVLQDSYHPGGT